MSDDFEEDIPMGGGHHDEEEEEEEVEVDRHLKKKRRLDDEEEEEEEEYSELSEEEPSSSRHKKAKRKKPKRKPKGHPFLDVEAEVDDDDDDEDEDEEYLKDDFLADPELEGAEEEARSRELKHRQFDRRNQEMTEAEMQRLADELKARHTSNNNQFKGDMDSVPQRLLMPSVNDANLWQVRVKPGRERDVVFSLMRKSLDLEFSGRPLHILSAFQRDSLPGMIYVEARSQQQVLAALQGLVGVFVGRGVVLVPIDEMASLLQIKKQETTIQVGDWVRIKRGKYAGDLAQVIDVAESGEEAGLKFVPRIDLNPKDDPGANLEKKRKKTTSAGAGGAINRPPQKLFNYEEVVKVYGRKSVSRRPGAAGVYVFAGDTYRGGFVEKDIRISGITTENVNPTLDEITQFKGEGSDEYGEARDGVDLSIIADAARKAAIAVLQPGDHVEVYEGEQAGMHGVVESIMGDIVTITAEGMDEKVEVAARSVRKRFKPGDHVKVMAGKNADETGLVVSVVDNVVTFLSDMTLQEVSVFSRDLREAAEVGSGTNIVGDYELHDLVQLDQQTVGVIYKTERDSFRVLDQHGQTRLVQPHQISMRRESRNAIATDSEGHELLVGDNVKEVDSPENRRGIVLHIHQSIYAFLHNRDIAENGGVFVTRCRSLASLAPRGAAPKAGGPDLTKMNPAVSGGAANMGVINTRGPRDKHVGVHITVVTGQYKGYNGIIKENNGVTARVELNTGNRVIAIDTAKLRRKGHDGVLYPLDVMGPPRSEMGPPMARTAGRTPNPYANGDGSRTPGAWGARTPNPYGGGGRTPHATSQTPNRPFDGGKTPMGAWNASSKTPNPYAAGGSKTPNPYGGKTPNPYGGGKTPNPYTGGGKTPNPWSAGSSTPNPYAAARGASSSSTSAPTPSAWSAPTPGPQGFKDWDGAEVVTPAPTNSWDSEGWGQSAPTPGPYSGAPTPFSAPTPGPAMADAAPTPGPGTWGGGWGGDAWGAPTPANDGWSAPTPRGGPYTAATPASLDDLANAAVPETDRPPQWLTPERLGRDKVRGLRVRVLGTKNTWGAGNTGWHDGKYESKVGTSVGVTTTNSSIAVTVNFGDEERSIPAEYLVPIPPSKEHDRVLLIANWHHNLRGSYYRYVSGDKDEASLRPEGSNSFVEIPYRYLCLVE